MSYLEYTVKHVPTGLRKIFYINWALVILLIAVSSVGFLMLYSVAGGSATPWMEPQAKRFAMGLAMMEDKPSGAMPWAVPSITWP